MLQYVTPDSQNKNYSVELATVLTGARSLVERCFYYLSVRGYNDKINHGDETNSILADHALISNAIATITTKADHDQKLITSLITKDDE